MSVTFNSEKNCDQAVLTLENGKYYQIKFANTDIAETFFWAMNGLMNDRLKELNLKRDGISLKLPLDRILTFTPESSENRPLPLDTKSTATLKDIQLLIEKNFKQLGYSLQK